MQQPANDTNTIAAPAPGGKAPAVELDNTPGQVLGHGFPDWPADLQSFQERKAYQRGVAHARAVDASVEDRPSAAATPLAQLYAEHQAAARRLGFANVTSALGGLARRLGVGKPAQMPTGAEIVATWNGAPDVDWAARVAGVIRKFCSDNGIEVVPRAPRYAVGDAVDYTNEYGVRFPGKTVIRIDTAQFVHGEPAYFIEPTDSPWVSFRESELTPTPSPEEKSQEVVMLALRHRIQQLEGLFKEIAPDVALPEPADLDGSHYLGRYATADDDVTVTVGPAMPSAQERQRG